MAGEGATRYWMIVDTMMIPGSSSSMQMVDNTLIDVLLAKV